MPVGNIFELLHVDYRGYVIVVITRDIREASPLYDVRFLFLLRVLCRLGTALTAPTSRFPQRFRSQTFEYHF